MRVAAYYRYSTDNKSQRDNSEERQKDSVERVVYGNGWTLVGSFTDTAVSGTVDKPKLIELMSKVQSGELKIDVLAVDSLSRLTRRDIFDIGKDIEWLRDAGVKISIAGKDGGRPFDVNELGNDLAMLVDGWQNNQYVKKLSRDVVNGMRTKFDRRILGWTGKAPYGYDLSRDKTGYSYLVANSDLPIIRQMFMRILAGYSVRGCVELLGQTERFKLRNTRLPSSSSVKHILRNSIYAGVRTYGVRGVGKHNQVARHHEKWVRQNPLVQAYGYYDYVAEGFKTCVTMEEFSRVQSILDSNQKSFRKHPCRRKHLFSGLIRCGHCGNAMCAESYKCKKTSNILIKYVCPKSVDGSGGCHFGSKPFRKSIREDELETLLVQSYLKQICRAEWHKRNLTMVVDRLLKRAKSAIAVVEQDLKIQQDRLAELTEMFLANGFESLKDEIAKQSQKLESLKRAKEESLEVDDVLAFAKAQYESGVGVGVDFYFGKVYEVAAELATIEDAVIREREMGIRASELSIEQRKVLAKWFDFGEVRKGFELPLSTARNAPQMIAGKWQMPLSNLLSHLRDISLGHIGVVFEAGIFRGKRRNLPKQLSLHFSVADTSYTGKCVVVTSDQIDLR